ncbi:MAG: hypothetical protein MR224_04335 [Dorea sp.]|nr:hypothetical protein [Dorea sp.]
MLDEKKVKLMTHLALYEQTQGEEDFKISAYYRKDYVSLHVIYSFISVTIGYVCAAALVALAGFDVLMEKMSNGFILLLLLVAFIGYILIVGIYIGISSYVFNRKHKAARQRVKRYNHNLIKLLKMYEKENE